MLTCQPLLEFLGLDLAVSWSSIPTEEALEVLGMVFEAQAPPL